MKAKQLKSLIFFTVIITAFTISSCNNSNYKEEVKAASTSITETYDAIQGESYLSDVKEVYTNPVASISHKIKTPKELKIIKSASIRYKVKNVKLATTVIKNMAAKYNAYISDLRLQNNLYSKENRFTIKVPNLHFDAIMDSISTVAEFVDYENITTKDVTEEYVDLETRLKTKLEVKARYETILRKNAKTVEDILKTEDKLRVIQEEIEANQGRLKYLTNKVSYSTIQIDLYETVDYKEEPIAYNKTFWSKTKSSLSNGMYAIEIVLLGLINIWPLLIIGGVIFVFIKKRLKKRNS